MEVEGWVVVLLDSGGRREYVSDLSLLVKVEAEDVRSRGEPADNLLGADRPNFGCNCGSYCNNPERFTLALQS